MCDHTLLLKLSLRIKRVCLRSEWSGCSASCGRGFHARVRNCIAEGYPESYTYFCVEHYEEDAVEIQDCYVAPCTCPQNGPWIETIINTYATAECTNGFTGTMTRFCNADAMWAEPDNAACHEVRLTISVWFFSYP